MGLQTYQVPHSLYATNRSKVVAALRSYYYSSSSSASPVTTGTDGTSGAGRAAGAAAGAAASDTTTRNLAGKVIYLKGGESATRHETDHEPIFRQESYFHYLFGVREPDYCGCIEIDSGASILFVPELPEEYGTIMGKISSTEEIRVVYGVDEVRYLDEVEEYLLGVVGRVNVAQVEKKKKEIEANDDEEDEKKQDGGSDTELNPAAAAAASDGRDNGASTSIIPAGGQILLLSGTNTDSGLTSTPPQLPQALSPFTNSTILHDILAECRVIKSQAELSLLRHVTELTSLAHVYTMSRTHPTMMEYQSESLFRHYAYYNFGARHLGYTAICGCGPSSAVLHYGHAGAPNDRRIEDGDICLFDMGAEYCCYGSDITCSFPASGTFSEVQRIVYEGVLNAQIAVYDMLRPGVSYVDCHKRAEVEILKALVELGVVVLGDQSLEELVDMRLGAVFMPHGLGHLIGIDTHDVGGYLPGHPERIMEPGLKSLRTARIMREKMTLTVEPGCYFIDHLIDGALDKSSPLKQYLNPSILNTFRGFGGVRLEDVVVITSDGCENFTICPRTVKEVEHVCGGGKWPPVRDDAPELRRKRLCDPNLLLQPCAGF